VISVIGLVVTAVLMLVRRPEKRPKPSHLAAEIGAVIGTLAVALSVS
jgi:hypothetical protein